MNKPVAKLLAPYKEALNKTLTENAFENPGLIEVLVGGLTQMLQDLGVDDLESRLGRIPELYRPILRDTFAQISGEKVYPFKFNQGTKILLQKNNWSRLIGLESCLRDYSIMADIRTKYIGLSATGDYTPINTFQTLLKLYREFGKTEDASYPLAASGNESDELFLVFVAASLMIFALLNGEEFPFCFGPTPDKDRYYVYLQDGFNQMIEHHIKALKAGDPVRADYHTLNMRIATMHFIGSYLRKMEFAHDHCDEPTVSIFPKQSSIALLGKEEQITYKKIDRNAFKQRKALLPVEGVVVSMPELLSEEINLQEFISPVYNKLYLIAGIKWGTYSSDSLWIYDVMNCTLVQADNIYADIDVNMNLRLNTDTACTDLILEAYAEALKHAEGLPTTRKVSSRPPVNSSYIDRMPRIRNLGAGKSASKEAVAKAVEIGLVLPKNHTYVLPKITQ
jgi:hypothetical protein